MSVEEIAALKAGEVLVRVAAVGLNHAETLIRSGNYTVRLPFPYPLGGEGSGTAVATGSGVMMPVGTRVCWGAVLGSFATFVTAQASLLVPIPDALSFEDGACLAVAGLTAGGIARVWPLKGRTAGVWGAAGAVGRMLVAGLAGQGINTIGIASGKRVEAVRAAGANHVIDRITEDVRQAVETYTGGCGVHEFAGFISDALALAAQRPAIITDIAGRFPLDQLADAYRLLESGSHGKVLVLPNV